MSATLQMGNGQVDLSGMTLHRSSNRAVEQSRTALYHNHAMALLQQYVCSKQQFILVGLCLSYANQ